MTFSIRLSILMAAGAISFALSANAHHSGAMFDDQKSMTLAGSVKSFQWSNPHCWIQVLVPGQNDTVEWSVEMGSPSQLFKGGWRPSTLKYGDSIVVTIRPMRDGTPGGLYLSATRQDGKPIARPTAN
ncbi:MAG: DUF6152 family protein [Pseudomonadota bacterium]|nr:DUF6152 family protein [Pseudomonadota bacterium]